MTAYAHLLGDFLANFAWPIEAQQERNIANSSYLSEKLALGPHCTTAKTRPLSRSPSIYFGTPYS
jgi:hypothetical protein